MESEKSKSRYSNEKTVDALFRCLPLAKNASVCTAIASAISSIEYKSDAFTKKILTSSQNEIKLLLQVLCRSDDAGKSADVLYYATDKKPGVARRFLFTDAVPLLKTVIDKATYYDDHERLSTVILRLIRSDRKKAAELFGHDHFIRCFTKLETDAGDDDDGNEDDDDDDDDNDDYHKALKILEGMKVSKERAAAKLEREKKKKIDAADDDDNDDDDDDENDDREDQEEEPKSSIVKKQLANNQPQPSETAALQESMKKIHETLAKLTARIEEQEAKQKKQ